MSTILFILEGMMKILRILVSLHLLLVIPCLTTAEEIKHDYLSGRLIVSFEQEQRFDIEWGLSRTTLNSPHTEFNQLMNNYPIKSYKSVFRSEALQHAVVIEIEDSSADIEALAARIAELPGIRAAYPDYIASFSRIPNEEYSSWVYKPYSGYYSMDVYGAWDMTTGSENVIVGVCDRGVDVLHPQLIRSIYVNPGEDIDHDGVIKDVDDLNGIDDDNNGYIDDLYGWNTYDGDGIIDPQFHGTAIAGVIAAYANDGSQVAGIAGGYYPSEEPVKILPTQITSSSGTGGGLSYVFPALEYLGLTCDVINISVDFYSTMSIDDVVPEWVDLMQNLMVPNDVVLIGAAGNYGVEGVQAPANSQYVIAVASTNPSKMDGILWSTFFSYGDKIDICAASEYNDFGYPVIHENNSPVTLERGTSISAPIVSGVAALVRILNPSLNRDEVRTILLSQAHPVNDPKYTSGKLGVGQIDAYKVLAEAAPPSPPVLSVISSSGPVVLAWNTPSVPSRDADVKQIRIERKIVNRSAVIENWAIQATVNASMGNWTDPTFGHMSETNTHAYYRAKFIDVVDKESNYSATRSVEGIQGLELQSIEPFATLPFINHFSSLTLHDDYLYINHALNGIEIVAFDDANSMQVTDTIKASWLDGQGQEVIDQMAFANGMMYGYYKDRIVAYDISNPAHPVLAAPEESFERVSPVLGLQVIGNALVAPLGNPLNTETATFAVYDISSPSVLQNSYTLVNYDNNTSLAHSASNQNLVVLGASGRIFQIDSPTMISNAGLYPTMGTVVTGFDSGYVDITGDHKLRRWTWESGQLVEGVTNADSNYRGLLASDGNRVVAVKQSDTGYELQILDMTSPGFQSEYTIFTTDEPYAIAMDAERLVAAFSTELRAWAIPNSSIGLNPNDAKIPDRFEILSVWPNPFNPSTSIRVACPERTHLQSAVYNVVGQKVASLADGEFTAGVHTLQFDGRGLASGVYFIRINVPGKMDEMRKIVLLR